MFVKTNISQLKNDVTAIFGDALNFYILQTEDILNSDWVMYSAMQVREIEAAQAVLPLLIENDGETFTSSASMAAVRETLVRFFQDLKGRSLLMIQRRVADLIDRIDEATTQAEATA